MTTKNYFKTATDIHERLIPPMGYCIATDRITVDGRKVGYMYRDFPDEAQDSGWRFFSADEDDDYANDPAKSEIFDVNTIAHYDT